MMVLANSRFDLLNWDLTVSLSRVIRAFLRCSYSSELIAPPQLFIELTYHRQDGLFEGEILLSGVGLG